MSVYELVAWLLIALAGGISVGLGIGLVRERASRHN